MLPLAGATAAPGARCASRCTAGATAVRGMPVAVPALASARLTPAGPAVPAPNSGMTAGWEERQAAAVNDASAAVWPQAAAAAQVALALPASGAPAAGAVWCTACAAGMAGAAVASTRTPLPQRKPLPAAAGNDAADVTCCCCCCSWRSFTASCSS